MNTRLHAAPVYVDVSEVLWNGLNTGIQRVVRSVVLSASQTGLLSNESVIPVVAVGGRFRRVLPEASLTLMPGGRVPARGTWVSSLTRHASLHQLKRAARRLPVLFGVAQNTFFSTAIRMQVSRAAQAGEVSFGPADTVLLLDSYWGGSSALLAAEKARRRGAHVATVVYDLIPITHPEFCDERLARVFPGCLEKAISISHRLLCISESTRQSLFKIYPVSKTCSSGVDVIRLGSEIGVGPPAALDAPINPRSYVMVGTIEPRKRHAIVLDAFEERWRRGAADQLVLIGKIGWRIEDFERRIRQHPELGKRLLLIEGADDAVMRAHVQGARAVIIASEVEGFGLPLIEALQLGVPVIASDIPVFREVGREYPVYFRMNDWRSLNDAIDRADVGYETRRDSLASFTWPSWGEATLEILRAAANADVSGHRDVAMD